MIDVRNADWKSQFLEHKCKAHRIGTTGYPNENPLALTDQPMFFDCFTDSGGKFQMPEGGLEPPT